MQLTWIPSPDVNGKDVTTLEAGMQSRLGGLELCPDQLVCCPRNPHEQGGELQRDWRMAGPPPSNARSGAFVVGYAHSSSLPLPTHARSPKTSTSFAMEDARLKFAIHEACREGQSTCLSISSSANCHR